MIALTFVNMRQLTRSISGGNCMKKLWILLVALLWVCGFAVYPAYAQLGSGTITGIVNDDQGNTLPGVSVSAKNTETGFERTDVSIDR